MNIRRKSALIPLSALSSEEAALLKDYLYQLRLSGVPLHVLKGSAPWDLRPLLLEEGRVWIYRAVPKKTNISDRHLTKQLNSFSELNVCDFSLLKSDAGGLFVRREYVADTLPEVINSSSPTLRAGALELAVGACELVTQLDKAGLVHGHFVTDNVALSIVQNASPSLTLLDPLLGALITAETQSGIGFAPEVFTEPPTNASDCFGLAGIVEELLDLQLTRAQRETLREMQHSNPKMRPKALDLRAELLRASDLRGNSLGPIVLAGGAVPSKTSVSDAQKSLPSPRRLTSLVVGSIALLIGLLVLHYRFPALAYRCERALPFAVFGDREELERLLDSGERLRVKEVARRATVGYTRLAEDIILERVLSGEDLAGIDNKLLRISFDPAWVDQLSASDKRAGLILSVLPLVPEAISQLPQFKTLHAGVILGILNNVSFDNPSTQLKLIPTSKIAELPDPVGKAFAQLSELGVDTVSDRSALALAALSNGNHDARAIEAYFGKTEDARSVLPRLEILSPFFVNSDPLAQHLYTFLASSGGLISQALGWFEIEKSSAWSSVPAAAKLDCLFGRFPKAQLTFEQLADLLLFPLPKVRSEARTRLQERYLQALNFPVLDYLASDNNKLTRTQNILLLATLYAKPGSESPFVSKWLDLKPPPLAVLSLLLSRQSAPPNDIFNFEATRYLKRTQWEAPPDALALLVAHPEALARSLGYARLRSEIPQERAILEGRLDFETEPNLKAELQRKLSRVPF